MPPSYPFPRWRPQLGAKPMNINIYADLSVEREPVIGQTLIDMRGRKSAWEGIQLVILILVVELNDIVKGQIIVSYTKKA